MSLKAINWVFDHSESTLGGRLVLLALADYAQDDGSQAFPSIETVARKVRMSRKGVQLALRRLEEGGHIERTGISALGTMTYRIRGVRGGEETTPQSDRGGEDSTPEANTLVRVKPEHQNKRSLEEIQTEAHQENGEEIQTPSTPPTPREQVLSAWETYITLVATPNGLRVRTMEGTHETLIRNALKVRSLEEVLRAIEGLSSSAHHRGFNDRKKKYLDLRYALKGNTNAGESNGERIDKAGEWVQDPISSLLATLPSEARAILLREKKQVEQALLNPGDQTYASRARHAWRHLNDVWKLTARRGGERVIWSVGDGMGAHSGGVPDQAGPGQDASADDR